MLSLEPIDFLAISVAIAVSGLCPLYRGKGYDPPVSWKTAIDVSIGKLAISALLVGAIYLGGTSAIADAFGEILFGLSLVGMTTGAFVLIFAGFWGPTDSLEHRVSMIKGIPTAPPSAGQVLKWSVFGALIFLLSYSLFEHPFAISGAFVSGGLPHSN